MTFVFPTAACTGQARPVCGCRRRRSSWRSCPPGDETWQKLPFYAEHHVDEVLLVDPDQRTVTWLQLHVGEYEPVQRSRLIDLGPAELAEQLDWP